MELNAPTLRHGRHTGSQAARKSRQDNLDRGWSAVFGCEYLRVIGVDDECSLSCLLRAEAEKITDRCTAVSAIDPLAFGAPSELSGRGGLFQRFARSKQSAHIHAVHDFCCAC